MQLHSSIYSFKTNFIFLDSKQILTTKTKRFFYRSSFFQTQNPTGQIRHIFWLEFFLIGKRGIARVLFVHFRKQILKFFHARDFSDRNHPSPEIVKDSSVRTEIFNGFQFPHFLRF